uniref:Uncharacterized protein n=1 Tax=Ditylenchus dipsaci TaxID=166011 RepID=A0A915E2G7_9BILA
MSLSKILDKVLSFRDSSPEASTHWLGSETAIFGLFFRVQFQVVSQGAFIVAEIFDNCVSQLSKTSKNFLSEVRKVHVLSARRIVNFKWEPVLEAICAKVNDEELKAVITTRHESLMCLLKNSFEKFESTPSTASA